MRILTGVYKGKAIRAPRGIRPTQDKVRKAIFDILGDIQGLSFLELFAGSGAIGFEAASRGAAKITLVEYNRECQRAIKQNMASLKVSSCEVYPMEADRAVKHIHREKKEFDIVFLDPPYYSAKKVSGHTPVDSVGGPGWSSGGVGESLAKKTLQTLGAYDIVAPNGLLVVQHYKKDDLPATLGVFSLFRQSHYGDTLLSIYRK